MEIKNKLTVIRGEVRRGYRDRRGKVKSRNMYKGPMDKAKWGRLKVGGEGGSGRGKVMGIKWRQL